MQRTSPVHVVAAVIFSEGCVLAARRARHKSPAGVWEFPGGKVESGEGSEDALKRELSEELGIEVKVIGSIDDSITLVGQALIQLESILCTLVGGRPLSSSDHDQLRWLSPGELDDLEWAEPDLPVVRKLANIPIFDVNMVLGRDGSF